MKNKTLYILFACILPVYVQSQNWQWAKQVGSNIVQSYDFSQVITDGNNSYLVGRYSGSITLNTTTLYSIGNNDLFIVKYDANGIEQWAKGFGGNGNISQTYESAYATYDSITNSIYITGAFYGTMILDTVDTIYAYNGLSNIYLAKLDLDGNFIWGKAFMNNIVDDVSYIYQYPNGNVLLAGEVGDSTYFGSFLIKKGGFLARFNSDGQCLWAANSYSGLNLAMPNIAFLNDDIFISGAFNSQFLLDTVTLTPNGSSYDCFLARLDSLGKIKWFATYGYSGSDGISSISFDNASNLLLAGSFTDSISIDGIKLYNSGQDMFVAKLTNNGSLIWSKQANVLNGNVGIGGLVILPDASFYLCGSFSGTASFDSNNITATNTIEMFLTRYNSNGNCLGVKHFGYASGNSVVIDNSGYPICSGGFQNTVTIGNNTFTSNGWFDNYVAKCDIISGNQEEERSPNNQLLIYANPNQGKCNIIVPDDFLEEKNLVLSIYDNIGKLIQQKSLEMNDGKIKLNLEAEAKGVYNVSLSNGKKSYSGKIVFQ